MIDIGKLPRVPLREVWKHEAHDFTQWMEDNIDVLNNVLEFDLVNVDREQAAGCTITRHSIGLDDLD